MIISCQVQKGTASGKGFVTHAPRVNSDQSEMLCEILGLSAAWRRHEMDAIYTLLAFCVGNSAITTDP